MTTSRPVRIPKKGTVDEVVEAINVFIRAGLRQTLVDKGQEWRPVWVRYPAPGRCLIQRTGDADVEISLDDLPPESRRLVAALLDLLDEQAWYARIARPVVEAELRVAAGRDKGEKFIQKTYTGTGIKAAKVRDEVAKRVAAGGDPWTKIPQIAKQAGCTPAYVRQILKAAEK